MYFHNTFILFYNKITYFEMKYKLFQRLLLFLFIKMYKNDKDMKLYVSVYTTIILFNKKKFFAIDKIYLICI